MKIVILMGSPNPNGSTAILVQSFRKGAEERGHKVEVIDVCSLEIHPCTGCIACGYEGDCVQDDDSRIVRKALLTVAWNADNRTFEALEAHYKTLVRYIHLTDMGMVLGYGCGTPNMTKSGSYPERAYQLGRSL